MIYVALTALIAATVVSLFATHAMLHMVRSHARERNLMLNQLLHLAGRTWEPPPSEHTIPDEELVYEERFTTAPTAMPDFYEAE